MALTKAEFHKICVQTFTEVYDGEPAGLHSFIKKIESLELLADSNDLKTILISIIVANVKLRALAALPKDPKTTEEIRNALNEKIKPEKSKIIEGRMLALKLDRGNFTDYSSKVEKLADRLKFSYIEEGMTANKANEMSIEKAIQLCKSNTNSVEVRTALTASQFDSVKDVVAKYVIVSQEDRQSKNANQNNSNILQYRANYYRNNPRGNFRGNSNRGFYQNNNFNNYNRRNNQNFQSNFNRSNHSNNYRGNSRGGYQNNGNYRGRQQNHGNFNHQRNSRAYTLTQGNCQTPPSDSAQNRNWRRAEGDTSD